MADNPTSGTPGAEALRTLRQKVEEVSLEILSLLNRRAGIALDIARHKHQAGLPIRDAHREAQLLGQLAVANQGPLDESTVKALFRSILDASVATMSGDTQKALKVSSASGPRVVVDVRGQRVGDGGRLYIAGPCSVESEEQLELAARGLAARGVKYFRAGAYKPRTSPYSFQGLGEEGLRLLAQVARRYGLVTVSEATSLSNLPVVAEYVDVIQIGARNMYNYDLLREVGRIDKPVLLKRAFSATIDEWLCAAEYVALGGNERIILCERGVRAFGQETRATLDLSAVPLLLQQSRLPVVVDVSHAAGRRDILAPLTTAAFAVGAHAVMLEVHPDPDVALSDAQQQLSLGDFERLQREVLDQLSHTARALGSRA